MRASLAAGYTEDLASIPALGRSSEDGNGYPLHYFCLENSMEKSTNQGEIYKIDN